MTSSQGFVKNAAVIGAGQMGAGIAQSLASAGIAVSLHDSAKDSLQRAKKTITAFLARDVEKGRRTKEDVETILGRIDFSNAETALTKCDLAIEAIVEDFSAKQELFTKLDRICSATAIFASNTSSISITKLAATTKRPEQFIGIHFMNPVPVMKLVEVIRGLQTSEETYQTALQLVKTIDKTAVTARRDYPGFIVNRILIPLLNEAAFTLMEGIASVEEIDTAMKLGTNMPMGPLELADFVGLDTCLAICRIFHNELGEDKYRPCPLLVKYVEAGWLGRKSGRGFYEYASK